MKPTNLPLSTDYLFQKNKARREGFAPITLASFIARLSLALLTFPTATPGFVAPVAAAPAAELGAVDRAAFTILKHAFLPVRPAGIDAERLHLSRIGIGAEGAVAHAEGAILAGNFFQTVGDIDVSAGSAVLRAQDDVLTGIAGGILGR